MTSILNILAEIKRLYRNFKYWLIRSRWTGPRVLAEGDSWFLLPLFYRDIIHYLNRKSRFQYAICDQSFPGDTLEEILSQDRALRALRNEQPDILLFSAGGNDLFSEGQLGERVHPFNHSLAPRDYLNDNFTDFIDDSKLKFAAYFNLVLAEKPDIKIFFHGYDYPIPLIDSVWSQLDDKGITDRALQRDILREMIDRFNEMQIEVAATYPGSVFHVDVRGIVGSRENWANDTHPLAEGFSRLATRFDEVIQLS